MAAKATTTPWREFLFGVRRLGHADGVFPSFLQGGNSMRQNTCTVLVAGALTLLVATAYAQKTTEVHPGKGGSPHVRSAWTIDGAQISIEYGRPYLKGRPE